jgi:hypothetical protein
VHIDVGLVVRCMRNLHFTGCITFLPLFLYSNQYIPKRGIRALLEHESVRDRCVDFVWLDRDKPSPEFTDVFRLYASLGPGLALAEWCSIQQPRQYNVDERRLVQFGIHFDFIRIVRTYACFEERIPT